jgi:hypothetical protein
MANPAWFDETYYLTTKLNQLQQSGQTQFTNVLQVKNAIEAAGLTAFDHFNAYSLVERTSPNQFFNTTQYLAAKANQLNAAQGVTTWTADSVSLAFAAAGFASAYAHYAQFGWTEGVNPSNAFDNDAYLATKAQEAGITVDELKAALTTNGLNPVSHYTEFGVTETGVVVTPVPEGERVDVGEEAGGTTFSLTTATGEVVTGTGGNDIFNAVFTVDDADESTLNVGDVVQGQGGTDTVNITMVGAAVAPPALPTAADLPAGSSITGGEVVNLILTGGNAFAGGNFFNSASYGGVQELWQVDNVAGAGTFQTVTVTDSVTAGFRSTGDATAQVVPAAATVDAATATQKSASAALVGVGNGSTITFNGAGLETVSVSGSVATAAGANALTVTAAAASTDVETVNIALTSDTTLTVTPGPATIKTVNMAGSEGDITFNAAGLAASLESLTGGTGADTLTVDLEQGVEATVSAGVGNDTVTLAGSAAATDEASTVALGSGKDTLIAQTVTNVGTATEEDFLDGLITVTDFSLADGDTLDLFRVGQVLTSTQLANADGQDSLFDAVEFVAGVLTTGTSAVFSYGDDAYVLADVDASGDLSGGDGLVKLTGVDATQFSTDQNGGLVL